MVVVSNWILGFIMIIIPQELVIVVPGAALKVVTELKAAFQLNTKDCALLLCTRELPGVLVLAVATEDTSGLVSVT